MTSDIQQQRIARFWARRNHKLTTEEKVWILLTAIAVIVSFTLVASSNPPL